MERLADTQTIQEMIDAEETLIATREDGLEECFVMGYRNEAHLRALLNVENQQEGRKWIVKDRADNIIVAPEIEINKPDVIRWPW